MDFAEQQARIDAVHWYHEFDFGNGLRTRSLTPDVECHRAIWHFIEGELDRVDFRGKSVLDIGCWDGYWSFYAERRGARSVLATDDRTQNWADGRGLLLARELYGSSVEVNQNVSVYQLATLGRKFDIILFLGVYYHLLDPFYAFSQLRHCCHENTVVLIEGSEALALRPNEALFNYADHRAEFLPTAEALEQMLQATYFTVSARAHQPFPSWALPPAAPPPQDRPGWWWRLRLCLESLRGSRAGLREMLRQIEVPPAPPLPQLLNRRLFLTCTPFVGEVALHAYPPPFGLDDYDMRFGQRRAA